MSSERKTSKKNKKANKTPPQEDEEDHKSEPSAATAALASDGPRTPPLYARGESAEDVFRASLTFAERSASVGAEDDQESGTLYPRMDDFSFVASAYATAEPIAVAASLPNIAAAPIATAATVFLEDGEDPVMRKIRQEEEMMNRAKQASTTPNNNSAHSTEEDAKPSAARAIAVITDHDVHPAEMGVTGVRAELVGEEEYTDGANAHQPVALPTVATVMISDDLDAADEAMVLDSKPAASLPSWSGEVSAEATVMGQVSSSPAWSTPQRVGDTIVEEIAVTGRDEAEATIVTIRDDIHPAEHVEGDSARAELIGSSNIIDQAIIPRAHSSATHDTAVVSGGFAVATMSSEEYPVATTSPGAVSAGYAVATAETVGSYLDPRSTQETVAEATHSEGVAGQDYAVAIATTETYDETREPRAMIVDIAEDVHPADIDVSSSVHAELVGRAESMPLEAEAHAIPEHPPLHAYSRAVSEPAKLTNPFEDDPRDTPALSRDAVAALDRLESTEWMNQPQHLGNSAIPPSPPVEAIRMDSSGDNAPVAIAHVMGTPPPIPSRVAVSRDRSHASNASQLSASSGISESGGNRQNNGRTSIGSSGSVGSNSGQRNPAHQALSNMSRGTANVVRSTNNVMERLFGSEGSRRSGDLNLANVAGAILQRTLLPWSVFPSETTGMWVATVNTNQKALDSNNITEASKALRAFSVPTKEQAEALARAWAPPRMLPFSENPSCFLCSGGFGVFKRPCHCRNCGVCICSGCAIQWPSKMIPDTYNIKRESIVNICKSCDWLCSAFRMALLDGNSDGAVAIHSTGNVNLVTPFANVKGELFYPTHCAVLGGSLTLLKWLVDTHCCPLRSIRISGKTRDSSGGFTAILTSRGRSLLGIAMEKENIDLVRYLVVDKGMPLAGEKDLSVPTLVRLLDRMLRIIPPADHAVQADGTADQEEDNDLHAATIASLSGFENGSPSIPSSPTRQLYYGGQSEESRRADELFAMELAQQSRLEQASEGSEGSIDDACIICFANTIDCVNTTCGHQICCMECSKSITKCPVCGVGWASLKVYRAN